MGSSWQGSHKKVPPPTGLLHTATSQISFLPIISSRLKTPLAYHMMLQATDKAWIVVYWQHLMVSPTSWHTPHSSLWHRAHTAGWPGHWPSRSLAPTWWHQEKHLCSKSCHPHCHSPEKWRCSAQEQGCAHLYGHWCPVRYDGWKHG